MGIVRRAATAAAVSGAATRAHNRNMRSQPAQAAPAPAAPAPTAPAGDDTAAKLQELAELHAKGVLSDEEFAAAKAKALGI
jgi:hypothetical protein